MQLELIAANLRSARQTLRLSQTTVGDHLGVPRQAISAFESGKREVTVRQLAKLANLYRREVTWFFTHQTPASIAHIHGLQRRRNASSKDGDLDNHDMTEVRSFHEDLRKLLPAGVDKPPSMVPMTPIRAMSQIADQVRQQAELEAPPVNVYKALGCFGIRLRMSVLRTISGAFIPGDTNHPAGVLINSDQPSDRQRYSAAHELGHYVLDHAKYGQAQIISPLGRRFHPMEVEADSFAAELLMPAGMLLSQLNQASGTRKLEHQVYLLADQFLVSFQAMIYRLANLGLITATQKKNLLETRPSDVEAELKVRRRARAPFHPKGLIRLSGRAKLGAALLQTADGVRQLQELAFEEYARQAPETKSAETAGSVYEKVALWAAETYPMARSR